MCELQGPVVLLHQCSCTSVRQGGDPLTSLVLPISPPPLFPSLPPLPRALCGYQARLFCCVQR